MVCVGACENKYFPRDLIFGAGKKVTEPSGTKVPLPFSLSQPAEVMHPPLCLYQRATSGPKIEINIKKINVA